MAKYSIDSVSPDVDILRKYAKTARKAARRHYGRKVARGIAEQIAHLEQAIWVVEHYADTVAALMEYEGVAGVQCS